MRVSVGLSLALLLKIATISKERISEIFAANNHQYTDYISSALQLLQENVEEPFYLNEYDFVIIGSGPGGCVLANRLTENKNWKVLLIEAGKVETHMQNVPLLAINNQKTQFDWYFKAEPTEDACLGMEDKRCILPRGRGVGGSSIINFMMYVRGHKNDYDRWAAAGNDGWSWKDVLPYFLKSERSTMENLQNTSYHSRKGDLSVEHNQFKTPLGEAFVEACKHLGQPEIDYNSGESLGVSYVQTNTLNGSRHTAFRAFIKPILNRPNLHIMINTRVTKILIDPQTKTAFGVEFLRNGRTMHVNATKEVILSAGTFHSPQILMLSGIGTQKDLEKIKIPLVHELPVGKFLTDHLAHFGPTMILNSTGSSLSMPDIFTMQYIYDYFQKRGPLTSVGGIEALSFLKTKLGSSRGSDMPDIELVGLSGGVHSDYSVATQRLGLKPEIFEIMYRPLLKQKMDTFTVVVMLFHPKSTGYIELRDADPLNPPKIYTNFLKNPDDVENILEGIKFVVRLMNTPIYQKLGAYLHSTPLPSCAHIHFGSDDYWRCSIRTIASTLHHQVGTSKMGPVNDKTAVVSSRLKVHGIHKLRVVDTSIIPESPTGHTNAPSYMIGEKAADLIKEEWK